MRWRIGLWLAKNLGLFVFKGGPEYPMWWAPSWWPRAFVDQGFHLGNSRVMPIGNAVEYQKEYGGVICKAPEAP